MYAWLMSDRAAHVAVPPQALLHLALLRLDALAVLPRIRLHGTANAI